MRITILQGAFLPVPPLRGGAIEKVWFRLGQAFARQGCEVTHVSRLCDGLPAEENLEGVRHLRVRGYESTGGSLQMKWRDLRYAWRAARVLPDADILVTNSLFAPVVIRKASRGVLYVHVGRYPKGQMKLYSRAGRLQAPTKVIAEAIRSEVPRLAPRVTSIPYPLSWEPEMEPTADPRERVILYLGRIHPEKGLRELVASFARMTDEARGDWRLEIRGPWRVEQGGAGQGFVDELKGLAKPAGGAVTFHEPLFEDTDLKRELKRASLFTYPSLAERGETFGLAALEAMSCGCPPLVSSLECFRDFIEDGRTGFVFDHRSGDIETALCARLTEILTGPQDVLTDVGEAARKAAASYALEPVSQAFLEDFRRVLSG